MKNFLRAFLFCFLSTSLSQNIFAQSDKTPEKGPAITPRSTFQSKKTTLVSVDDGKGHVSELSFVPALDADKDLIINVMENSEVIAIAPSTHPIFDGKYDAEYSVGNFKVKVVIDAEQYSTAVGDKGNIYSIYEGERGSDKIKVSYEALYDVQGRKLAAMAVDQYEVIQFFIYDPVSGAIIKSAEVVNKNVGARQIKVSGKDITKSYLLPIRSGGITRYGYQGTLLHEPGSSYVSDINGARWIPEGTPWTIQDVLAEVTRDGGALGTQELTPLQKIDRELEDIVMNKDLKDRATFVYLFGKDYDATLSKTHFLAAALDMVDREMDHAQVEDNITSESILDFIGGILASLREKEQYNPVFGPIDRKYDGIKFRLTERVKFHKGLIFLSNVMEYIKMSPARLIEELSFFLEFDRLKKILNDPRTNEAGIVILNKLNEAVNYSDYNEIASNYEKSEELIRNHQTYVTKLNEIIKEGRHLTINKNRDREITEIIKGYEKQGLSFVADNLPKLMGENGDILLRMLGDPETKNIGTRIVYDIYVTVTDANYKSEKVGALPGENTTNTLSGIIDRYSGTSDDIEVDGHMISKVRDLNFFLDPQHGLNRLKALIKQELTNVNVYNRIYYVVSALVQTCRNKAQNGEEINFDVLKVALDFEKVLQGRYGNEILDVNLRDIRRSGDFGMLDANLLFNDIPLLWLHEQTGVKESIVLQERVSLPTIEQAAYYDPFYGKVT
ncbi:MAG: hypothetical protein V1647_00090, partial [Pseudomonadota bacterium]